MCLKTGIYGIYSCYILVIEGPDYSIRSMNTRNKIVYVALECTLAEQLQATHRVCMGNGRGVLLVVVSGSNPVYRLSLYSTKHVTMDTFQW